MVTTNIGKIFLQAYNVKYEKNYTAKDFFDKVFFPLVLDSPKYLAVSTCKCTARKVKEYFRKNTQKGYENLIFLLGDGLFCQQLW